MIQELSDHDLHQTVLSLRQSEKATVKSLLQHLRAVKQRKLYCDYGCSSLHTYCVKILNYSDSEAWARVKTLDLIEDKPTLEFEIDKKLNLTNAASLQQLFEVANYDQEKKDQELIELLLQEKREEIDQGLVEVKTIKTETKSNPRSISSSKKHLVYKNAGSKCENCGSIFNLNIDHIKPVGIGGTNHLTNHRLLCRSCNIRSAIKVFGVEKMKIKTSAKTFL